MKYANLHKRNQSKFQKTTKRLATVSLFALALTIFTVLPLTSKANKSTLANDNQIVDVATDDVVEETADL